jgi:ribokinase
MINILTIGGATQDIAFTTPESLVLDNPTKDLTRQKLIAFEYGAKINIKDVHLTFGGGAANAAVNFKRLGFKAAALICVGADAVGQQIIENMQDHQIDVSLVQTSEQKKSGFSTVILTREKSRQPADRTLFTYRGANEDLKISTYQLINLSTYHWIYISSLSQKNWRQELVKLFRDKKNTKIAWNPGNLQLQTGLSQLADLIKQVDVFIVNKDEALELVKSTLPKWNSNNPRQILAELKKYTPGVLVITDGPKGAYAVYDRAVYFQAAQKVREVDTTGVGDAFGSTFVAGLEWTHGDIEKSLRLGIIQSANVLKKYGAQHGLLTRQQIFTN